VNECQPRGTTNTLSVDDTEIVDNGKGGLEKQTVALVENLLITADQLEVLSGLRSDRGHVSEYSTQPITDLR
jgi:hypothetical protein